MNIPKYRYLFFEIYFKPYWTRPDKAARGTSYHLGNETNIEVKVKVVQSQDLLVAFQPMGNGYGSRGLAEPITIRVADGVRVVI